MMAQSFDLFGNKKYKTRISELEQQIGELRAENEKLETRVDKRGEKTKTAIARKQEVEEVLNRAHQRITTLENELTVLREESSKNITFSGTYPLNRSGLENIVFELGSMRSKPGKEITDHAIIQDSNGKIRTTVAGDKHSIGFLSLGYASSDVKTVALDGVAPSTENVRSGEYAISRTLLMITKGDPDEDEQAFLDFVLSEAGQKIVSDVHYIPGGNPRALFTPFAPAEPTCDGIVEHQRVSEGVTGTRKQVARSLSSRIDCPGSYHYLSASSGCAFNNSANSFLAIKPFSL